MSTPAKSIRVPIGKRAYFMGNLIPPTPSNNSQTITIDKNGFHEIREDLDGEKTSNTTTKTTSNPTKNITKTNSKSKISESEKSDESLFARLEELERQEQAQSSTKISKPLPSKTSKLVRDNSAEVNALETRIAQIKAQDDYDENDALMKELKQLRKRHRTILQSRLNPSKSSSAVPNSSSKNKANTATATATATTTTTTTTAAPPIPTSASTTPSASNPTTQSISPTTTTTTTTIDKLKEAGNTAFKDKDYGTAIAKYTEAISTDTEQIYTHVLLSNRSLTFLKSRFYNEAEKDAEKIIKIKPKWAKGFYRLASAMFEGAQETGKTVDDALRTIERGLSCEPKNKALLKLRRKIVVDQKAANKKEEQINQAKEKKIARPFVFGSIVERNNSNRSNSNNVPIIPLEEEATTTLPKETKKKEPKMSAFRRRRLGLE